MTPVKQGTSLDGGRAQGEATRGSWEDRVGGPSYEPASVVAVCMRRVTAVWKGARPGQLGTAEIEEASGEVRQWLDEGP